MKLFDYQSRQLIFIEAIAKNEVPIFMDNQSPNLLNLASITHEFKNPLSNIINFAELLKDSSSVSLSQLEEYALSISVNGKLLMNLMKNILDFSLIQQGQVNIEKKLFSLKELLIDLHNLFAAQINYKFLSFDIINHVCIDYLISDRQKIYQILINLIGNALKFTHQGAITIEVNLVNKSLIFLVKDTGIGISPQNLPHLFSPFFRANPSASSDGFGLGLFISKNLANSLGGNLTVTSSLGIGSTFKLLVLASTQSIPTLNPENKNNKDEYFSLVTLTQLFNDYRPKLSDSLFQELYQSLVLGHNPTIVQVINQIEHPVLREQFLSLVKNFRLDLLRKIIRSNDE